MTRPKVAPDKRQRTAIACDSCKRRKQKCNGQSPCSNCSRRSLICTYGLSDSENNGSQSASKRRMLESPQKPSQGWEETQRPISSVHQGASLSVEMGHVTPGDIRVWGRLSRGTNSMSGEEEAVVYNSSRMLQDPTGRLCKSIQFPRFRKS